VPGAIPRCKQDRTEHRRSPRPSHRRPRAAQAVLGDIPAADLREHMIRLAARERLGDGAGLARAVDLALPALLAPAGRPALALLVRTRPLAAAALHARVGAALLPALADVWSGLRAHADDLTTRSAALAGLHWIAATPTTPDQRRRAAPKNSSGLNFGIPTAQSTE